MKQILCYGDSNTWGFIPGRGQRYPRNIRWTGILADRLGEGYQIIEAGLNGRTTVYDDPFNPDLNGLKGLTMVLAQSAPVDLVILCLGTNDLKFQPAVQAARGVGKLIETCRKANDLLGMEVLKKDAKILVISPIVMAADYVQRNPFTSFRPDAPAESRKFPEAMRHFAHIYGAEYLDAAQVAVPSPGEGVHMEPESHAALAEAIYQKVLEIL